MRIYWRTHASIAVATFLLWPFHHWPRHRANDTPAPMVVPDAAPATQPDDPRCEKDGDTYYFLGPDGMVGMSNMRCDDAHEIWRNEPAAHVRMLRA